MATDLAALVGGTVTWDPEPDGHVSAWRTYRACLESRPADATNLCVLQDDTVPVWGFRRIIERAVAARPDRILALFVGGDPPPHAEAVHLAGHRGDDWAHLTNDRWFPVVASVWPCQLIDAFLAWVDGQNYPWHFTADDEIVGRWMTAAGVTGLATVPSLVEHPDATPSITGRRAWAGEDLGRVATCLPPAGCDLHACDWTQGPG